MNIVIVLYLLSVLLVFTLYSHYELDTYQSVHWGRVIFCSVFAPVIILTYALIFLTICIFALYCWIWELIEKGKEANKNED